MDQIPTYLLYTMTIIIIRIAEDIHPYQVEVCSWVWEGVQYLLKIFILLKLTNHYKAWIKFTGLDDSHSLNPNLVLPGLGIIIFLE